MNMIPNQNIRDYTDKIGLIIGDIKKCGLDFQPYEKTIKDLVVERGFCITDGIETFYIPTWKLVEE